MAHDRPFPTGIFDGTSSIIRVAGGGVAGLYVTPLQSRFQSVSRDLQRAGAVLWEHMLDKGDIWRHEALQGGRRFLLASVLASSIVCGQSAAANAQGLEKFFTNPRLAEKSTAAKIASDALALSADQAIWAALAFEDNEKLQQLLKHGANANTTEELSLMTPLMAAEALPLAWTLLEAGANARARDRTGKTPLHYAPKMRDGAVIIPLLVRAGADINARADEPAPITPLFCAMENYFEATEKTAAIQIIRIMVQYGADINITDGNGASVLAIAAAHNRPELIKLLIELGADPTKRLGNGRIPLDYAREANAMDVIQLLAGTTAGVLSGN